MAPLFEGFQESSIFRSVSQVTCHQKKSQSLYLIGCDFRRVFFLDRTNMQKKHIPISSMGLDGTGIFTWMVDYGKLSGKCVIRGCYGTFFSGPLQSGNKATHKYHFTIKHAYVFSWCFQLNHVSNCAWKPPCTHLCNNDQLEVFGEDFPRQI